MYKKGDTVEFIYRNQIGSGAIIKVRQSLLFGDKYLIKAIVTRRYCNGHEETYEKVFCIRERDIIGKLSEKMTY